MDERVLRELSSEGPRSLSIGAVDAEFDGYAPRPA